MRFSTKLILVCESIFIILTIITGSVIGSMAYEKTRQSEIDSYIYEADNIINNIKLYLTNGLSDEKKTKDYATSIVDIFGKDNVNIEIYDEDFRLLAGSPLEKSPSERLELKAALKNKGEQIFLSRHIDDGRYFAFFSQYIEHENDGVLISIVKDISVLDAHKNSIFTFVIRTMMVGIIVVAIVIGLAAYYLMRPINHLKLAARRIAVGDYSKRLDVTSDDEFGALAVSFNIMAEAVEGNIAELEERYEAQQQMMDNITHELRTPLTSIIGYAELLQKMPYDKAQFNKGLGYIYSEGKRMLNLNKTLLDLTYYKHGESRFETVDILPLLKETSDLVAFRAEQKNVQVQVKEENVQLDLVPELIRSLLTNLLDNALKACRGGDLIILAASQAGDECILTVKDTGKGMTASQLAHITEPFYQVDKARTKYHDDSSAGLGLGLAIVEQITQKHHGRLRFKSELEKGTEVSIYLPIKQQSVTNNEEK